MNANACECTAWMTHFRYVIKANNLQNFWIYINYRRERRSTNFKPSRHYTENSRFSSLFIEHFIISSTKLQNWRVFLFDDKLFPTFTSLTWIFHFIILIFSLSIHLSFFFFSYHFWHDSHYGIRSLFEIHLWRIKSLYAKWFRTWKKSAVYQKSKLWHWPKITLPRWQTSLCWCVARMGSMATDSAPLQLVAILLKRMQPTTSMTLIR